MFKKFIITFILMFSVLFTASVNADNLNFSDISNHWAAGQINQLYNKKVIYGFNGHFRPNDNITHSEFNIIVNNIMNYPQNIKFNPVNISDNMPADNITRENAVVILSNLFCIEPSNNLSFFSDENNISSEAMPYISGMAEKGYIIGRENKKFDPKSGITRAETATLINKIVTTLYSNSGIYTGTSYGTAVVNTNNAVLDDMIIKGDLILSEGISEGAITINNTTVEGKVYVRGGGINCVKIDGTSKIDELICGNTNGSVRIECSNNSTVSEINISDGKDDIILNGKIGNVIINTNKVSVKAVDADIYSIEILAALSKLEMDLLSTADNVLIDTSAHGVKINGEGNIDNATINANNTHVDINISTLQIAQQVEGTTNGKYVIEGGKTVSLVYGLGFNEILPNKTLEKEKPKPDVKQPALPDINIPPDTSDDDSSRPRYSDDADLSSIAVNNTETELSDLIQWYIKDSSPININIKRSNEKSTAEYSIKEGEAIKIDNDTFFIDKLPDLPCEVKIIVTSQSKKNKHEYILLLDEKPILTKLDIIDFKPIKEKNNISKGIYCKWNMEEIIKNLSPGENIISINVKVYSKSNFILMANSKPEVLENNFNNFNKVEYLLTGGTEFANRAYCENWTYDYYKLPEEWLEDDIPTKVAVIVETDSNTYTAESTEFNDNIICTIDTPCWSEIIEEAKIYNATSIDSILNSLSNDNVCNIVLPQNITVEGDIEIPSNKTLIIPNGRTLTFNNGILTTGENGFIIAQGDLGGTGYISPESKDNITGDGVQIKIYDKTFLDSAVVEITAFEEVLPNLNYCSLKFKLNNSDEIIKNETVLDVKNELFFRDKLLISANMKSSSAEMLNSIGINDEFIICGEDSYRSESDNWEFQYFRGPASGIPWNSSEKPNHIIITITTNKSVYIIDKEVEILDSTLEGFRMFFDWANFSTEDNIDI